MGVFWDNYFGPKPDKKSALFCKNLWNFQKRTFFPPGFFGKRLHFCEIPRNFRPKLGTKKGQKLSKFRKNLCKMCTFLQNCFEIRAILTHKKSRQKSALHTFIAVFSEKCHIFPGRQICAILCNFVQIVQKRSKKGPKIPPRFSLKSPVRLDLPPLGGPRFSRKSGISEIREIWWKSAFFWHFCTFLKIYKNHKNLVKICVSGAGTKNEIFTNFKKKMKKSGFFLGVFCTHFWTHFCTLFAHILHPPGHPPRTGG